MENRKFLIIHNPVSGSRNKSRFTKVIQLLEKTGCQFTVKSTEYAGHGTELVRHALDSREDWSAIVGAGGDGTIAELANAMHDTQIPLGIIPMGTANVLAREVGIGVKLEKVVSTLATAAPVGIYPGRIGDRRFLLMASAGFDSLAVSELRGKEKKKFGAFAYVLAAARASKQFKTLDLSIKVDGEVLRGASIIVSRSRLFGGAFVAAPKADLRNADLHILILRDKGIWAVIKYGIALLRNRIATLPSVHYIQTSGPVELNSLAHVPCQIDGDEGPVTPLTIHVEKSPLNLLAAYPETL